MSLVNLVCTTCCHPPSCSHHLRHLVLLFSECGTLAVCTRAFLRLLPILFSLPRIQTHPLSRHPKQSINSPATASAVLSVRQSCEAVWYQEVFIVNIFFRGGEMTYAAAHVYKRERNCSKCSACAHSVRNSVISSASKKIDYLTSPSPVPTSFRAFRVPTMAVQAPHRVSNSSSSNRM